MIKYGVLLAAAVLAETAAQALELPGQRFSVSPTSLARPYATPAVANDSKIEARASGTLPKAPDGFTVSVFAEDLPHARWMTVAPNGDVFLAESVAGKVVVLRPAIDGARAARISTFASGFDRPHGLAVHNGQLYVADVKSLWRLPYSGGALSASGKRVRVAETTPSQGPGHFTRDIVFDSKGTLYLTIGSRNNVSEEPLPYASVQIVKPDGSLSTFASGLRNPVGIAFYPGTNDLYGTVNERD